MALQARPKLRGEVEDLSRVIEQAQKLAIHLCPDLDALLSVWMCQRMRWHAGIEPAEVIYVPANTTEVEEGTLALGMGAEAGLNYFGHGYAIRRSISGGSAGMAVFRTLPDQDQVSIEGLVCAVSDAEETGRNIFEHNLRGTELWRNVSTRSQIVTTNIWHLYLNLNQVLTNQQLLTWWSAYFDGLIKTGEQKRLAVGAVKNAEYLFDNKLAILPYNSPKESTKAAFNRGAHLVLFSAEIGGNRWALGLSRNPRASIGNPFDLTRLRDLLLLNFKGQGIYINPSGHMAGWSMRAPLICTSKEFHATRAAFLQVVVYGLGQLDW